VGQEEEVFLDKTEQVWTPASASEGKVVGQHTYPFSIPIPRDTTIAPTPKAAPKRFSLPPTFTERASPAYIDYKVYVTVRRGRLRVNNRCVHLSLSLFRVMFMCRWPRRAAPFRVPFSFFPAHTLSLSESRLVDGDFVRTGCRRALCSCRAVWRTRRPLYALWRMLKAGRSLAQTRTLKVGRFSIPSRSRARCSTRAK